MALPNKDCYSAYCLLASKPPAPRSTMPITRARPRKIVT